MIGIANLHAVGVYDASNSSYVQMPRYRAFQGEQLDPMIFCPCSAEGVNAVVARLG